MNQVEIKSILHERIENIDYRDFLLSMKRMIDTKYAPEEPPVLARWQVNRIEESKTQILQGKGISESEAYRIADEWLKKKKN